MSETLEEAKDRADALERLLWLAIRQIGGKLTVRPPTLLQWSEAATLRMLQDTNTGGITVVADIRGAQPQAPSKSPAEFTSDIAMLGYQACERGEPCLPPEHLHILDRSLWIQGWKLRKGSSEEP